MAFQIIYSYHTSLNNVFGDKFREKNIDKIFLNVKIRIKQILRIKKKSKIDGVISSDGFLNLSSVEAFNRIKFLKESIKYKQVNEMWWPYGS